jgi:hypothetical protein
VNRQDLVRLLPCYVAGDLDAELAQEVEQLIRRDPDLGSLARDLQQEHELVTEVIRLEAPLALEARLAEALPPPAPKAQRPRPLPGSGQAVRAVLIGAAIAVGAAAAVLSVQALTSPRAAQSEGDPRLSGLRDGHRAALERDGWLDPSDADGIRDAADAAGVPARVQVIPELDGLGLRTEAVAVLPGNPSGFGVVHHDGSHRVVSQMWTRISPLGPPTQTTSVGAVDIRAYQAGELALTVFESDGVEWVMSSSDLSVAALVALTERRVRALG